MQASILEGFIYEALSAYDEPVSVGTIAEDLHRIHNRKWAYTTVKTVLDRLVKKNNVERVKASQGRHYFYRAIQSPAVGLLAGIVAGWFGCSVERAKAALDGVTKEMMDKATESTARIVDWQGPQPRWPQRDSIYYEFKARPASYRPVRVPDDDERVLIG